jgi:hypothetical protein
VIDGVASVSRSIVVVEGLMVVIESVVEAYV